MSNFSFLSYEISTELWGESQICWYWLAAVIDYNNGSLFLLLWRHNSDCFSCKSDLFSSILTLFPHSSEFIYQLWFFKLIYVFLLFSELPLLTNCETLTCRCRFITRGSYFCHRIKSLQRLTVQTSFLAIEFINS